MSQPPPAPPSLAELRKEIDAIDEGMHHLLMQRGDIIDRLIQVKQTQEVGSAFRPAREAAMMREIALRFRDGLDGGRRAEMRDIGDGKSEVKPRRIAHRRFTDGDISMHGERRLDIGEGRDDDAPDALDGVERQDAAMTLDQVPHHAGLARGTKR